MIIFANVLQTGQDQNVIYTTVHVIQCVMDATEIQTLIVFAVLQMQVAIGTVVIHTVHVLMRGVLNKLATVFPGVEIVLPYAMPDVPVAQTNMAVMIALITPIELVMEHVFVLKAGVIFPIAQNTAILIVTPLVKDVSGLQKTIVSNVITTLLVALEMHAPALLDG